MPRKQLNIGLTPEQRAQVDEIATALDTTPTEFARSAILEAVQLQRALTAAIGVEHRCPWICWQVRWRLESLSARLRKTWEFLGST